jgi:hypothetical protein
MKTNLLKKEQMKNFVKWAKSTNPYGMGSSTSEFMKFVHRHMIEQDRDRWFSKRVQTRRKLFTKIRNGLEDYDNFILSRDRNHYVNRLNDYIKSRYERNLNV